MRSSRITSRGLVVVWLVASCLCCAPAQSQTPSQTPSLQLPSAIAYDAAGNLYVADTNRNQILEATIAGQLVVVAGTGTQGYAGDNGPATAAELNAPQGLAFGPDGTLYIADTANHRIRAVTAGQITTIAGSGTAGYSGDGASAIAAALRSPTALALDPTGALLLCDTGNHRIRRITNGTITTIAGSGKQGFSGDNGPATSAELDTPLGIASFAAGAFYIADAHNDRIRAVGLDGIIHTVVGTGTRGFSGDGGPATKANLALPGQLALGSAGLIVSDANNQRVRLLDSSGVITTVAGSGIEGKASDGDATLTATIDTPAGLAISPFGWVTFADSANRMLRSVANGQLFAPSALAAARSSKIVTTPASAEVYGAATLNLAVSGSVGTPQGEVQLRDGTALLAVSPLKNGYASLSLPNLTGGQHSLTATYLGDSLNPAATLATNLTITPAPSVTTENLTSQNVYAGLPLQLNSQVVSTTTGVPTGTVEFFEGQTLVASGQLAGVTATGVYLNPPVGTHMIYASYGGDGNFQPSNSTAANLVLQSMPDFVLSSTAPTQTVQGGSIAVYPITIAAQPGPFTGAVTMSASGLPSGSTVTFAPSQLVPGSGFATVQMSVTTAVKTVDLAPGSRRRIQAATLLIVFLIASFRRRKLLLRLALCTLVGLSLLPALGCGNRSIAAPEGASSSFAIMVTGTSTNLAGAVVTHSTVVQLTVR